jgi:hypothetical protein
VTKVFVAQHPTEAHLVAGLLKIHGVEAVVRGEPLFAVRGEVPVTPSTLPSVWVADSLVEIAREIIDNRANGAPPGRPAALWRCGGCGELVEPDFDVCWNCGASR